MTISIKADSIFSHSLAVLTFSSNSNFSVFIELEIIQIYKGQKGHDSKSYIPIEDKKMYVLEVEVIGIFQERVVDINKKNVLANHYGMRFYPFVSSTISANFKIDDSYIDYVTVELPDKYRSVFDGANVRLNTERGELRHSFSFNSSKFIFNWNSKENINTNDININIPVRFGTVLMSQLVLIPIFYLLISLLGIALASSLGWEKMSVSVAAVLLFMLKQWTSSNLPQQDTILTRLYLLAAALVLIWGICWLLFGYWGTLLTIPISIFVGFVCASYARFNRLGTLPYKFAYQLAALIGKKDKSRVEYWKMKKFLESGGDK